uniref:Uncharacterized protein n=1 Tax=Setaria digitata TaxID=48799 RepID=A0A915PFY9_9BILA
MVPTVQHFKLLMHMKKPKPWHKENDNDGNGMSRNEKMRNVNRICRRLAVSRAPSILLNFHTPRISKKSHKLKAEPPFLIRNCISGHKNLEIYAQKIQQWAKKCKRRKRNGPFSSSFTHNQSRVSCNDRQSENVPVFQSESTAKAALLRSFYTIWYIGRITRKSLRSSEETEMALKELSLSPVVEKCLVVVPKGGIGAEMITDKSQLSKRALQTLSRWARITEGVIQDGYESGYDDDPVEIWNRAIAFANTSYTESESDNAMKLAVAGTSFKTSFSTNADEATPRRRRSSRLFKAVNSNA